MGKRPDQNNQTERQEQGHSTAITRAVPRPGTVKANVLNAFLRGEKLTPKDAWLKYGTSRLAAIVFDLKQDGWPILMQLIEVSTAGGRIAHVGQYQMEAA